MITLDFKYKYADSDKWETLKIEPDEYFDLDEGEEMEVWSVPEYSDLIDYITSDRENVSSIILKISDDSKNESVTFNQVFWNNQRNSFVETTDMKDGVIDYEFIIVSLVQDDLQEKICEIIRIDKNKNGFLKPTHHSFITEDEDGLVDDRKVSVK
jgi:hypothetical protein